MKLTAQIQLLPTSEEAAHIIETMRVFASAATMAHRMGRQVGATSRYTLHRVAYHAIRCELGVSCAIADTAVKHAAAGLTRDRLASANYADGGALPLDKDSLRFTGDDVSIRMGSKRLRVCWIGGERQRAMLVHRTRHATLNHRNGRFYLHVTCNIPEAEPIQVKDFIGVDLGVANVATTSEGEIFTGEKIEAVRVRHFDRRRRLNREATRQKKRGKRPKNVRRALKRLGRRESLFRRDVNHCITKKVVALAEGTKRGIAVEDLTGIRSRIRFAKSQRAKVGSWAFAQWQAYCAYKAQRAGVPYVGVNPAYTSQTCNACAVVDKESRLDQARFVCTACGHAEHADINAAQNIAARALAKVRMVAEKRQKIAA